MVVVYSESLVLPSRVATEQQQQQNGPSNKQDESESQHRPVWKQNQSSAGAPGSGLETFGDDCMEMLRHIEERESLKQEEDEIAEAGPKEVGLVTQTSGDLLLSQSYSNKSLDESMAPLLQSLVTGFATQVRTQCDRVNSSIPII